jgi:hypothetical protein
MARPIDFDKLPYLATTKEAAISKYRDCKNLRVEIEARDRTNHARLEKLEDRRAEHSLARALAQDPPGPPVDRAEIEELRESIAVDRRALPIAQRQEAAAEVAMLTAVD